MYQVKFKNSTQMIGPIGPCWIYLRDRFGSCSVKDITDAGWQIVKVRRAA